MGPSKVSMDDARMDVVRRKRGKEMTETKGGLRFPFPPFSLPSSLPSQTCQHRTICETHPPASRLTN
jgi:hypothetical protein